jgi:hypothetical protein
LTGASTKSPELASKQSNPQRKMKIVINKKYGNFGLSEEAVLLYGDKKGLNIIAIRDEVIKYINHYYLNEEKEENLFCEWDIKRNDPVLVEVVEQLGDLANTRHTRLKVVEVPDDVEWYIHDYDGIESVYEKHRIWD